MKKSILIIILFLSLNALSQGRGEKLKALKVAFITERLDLTQEEAQEFWPIYNTYEDNERKLRMDTFEERKDLDIETLSETEANELINNFTKAENERHQLKQTFIEEIRKVLPAKKVILLTKAEDDFKRQMLEQFKRRRQGRP